MRTSCVNHPERERLVIYHQWQLDYCKENVCAAALLSFFEYWHSIKLDMKERAERFNQTAETHGESERENDSLWQHHSAEELEEGLLHSYKKDTIRKAILFLEEKKVIDVGHNPNPRFHFDRTKFYLFHPEIVNQWLAERAAEKSSIDLRKIVNGETKNRLSSTKNRRTITETSSETSKEISTSESKSASQTRARRDPDWLTGSLSIQTPINDLSFPEAELEEEEEAPSPLPPHTAVTEDETAELPPPSPGRMEARERDHRDSLDLLMTQEAALSEKKALTLIKMCNGDFEKLFLHYVGWILEREKEGDRVDVGWLIGRIKNNFQEIPLKSLPRKIVESDLYLRYFEESSGGAYSVTLTNS